MPELPDVEGFRRVLAQASGRRVSGVRVTDAGSLRETTPQELAAALTGHRLAPPRRHGKWLVCPTAEGPTLLLHFGMTGALHWAGPGGPDRLDRVLFDLDGATLCFHDQRKLQGVWLALDERAVAARLERLGPDAATVDATRLGDALRARHKQLKAALLDQTVIAGLGNLLADEVLWRARLAPTTRTDTLDAGAVRRLHEQTATVLADAIPAGRVPGWKGWLTGVRDEPDPACPRCGCRLRRARVAGRTTVWCPRCQPQESPAPPRA